MRRTDLVTAAVLLVSSLVAIFYLIPTYVAPSPWQGDLSPAFMPYVAALLGMAAMIALLVQRLARAHGGDDPPPLTRRSFAFVGAVVFVLAATYLLLEHVGYLAGAAFIVAGFMTMARAGVRATLLAAIAFPVSLWFVFDRLLGLPLP
jgi:ABC-type Co2+ transport system permease subunit